MDLKNLKLNNFKSANIFCVKASRAWFLLIIFFTFVNIIILGYSAYLYFRIDLGKASNSNIEVNTDEGLRIRKSDFLKVINYFDNKESEFNQLRKDGPTKIIDPSL